MDGHLAELVPGAYLSDQAYFQIRDAIVSGRLASGTKLSVPALARQLNISRSPAREAMIRLAKEGLVELIPRKGATVIRLTRRDLRDLYQLREVLEGLASRLAAELIDTQGSATLERIMEAHRRAVGRGDVEAHRRLDLEFHSAIRDTTGDKRLIAFLEQLQGQIRVALILTSGVPGRMQMALQDHERIYATIVARDPGAAEEATRQHIRRLRLALAEE